MVSGTRPAGRARPPRTTNSDYRHRSRRRIRACGSGSMTSAAISPASRIRLAP
ncbi:hypothetical protein [Streptomyces sp. Je 1-332]|uniref:hypothetical protein n=1 Tax=Streptomyces sp. Je 1-332 TaxID=3231270 RepID=UPI00345B0B2D